MLFYLSFESLPLFSSSLNSIDFSSPSVPSSLLHNFYSSSDLCSFCFCSISSPLYCSHLSLFTFSVPVLFSFYSPFTVLNNKLISFPSSSSSLALLFFFPMVWWFIFILFALLITLSANPFSLFCFYAFPYLISLSLSTFEVRVATILKRKTGDLNDL